MVLIDALLSHDKVIYQDHKAEPSEVLKMLNTLSEGKLEHATGYAELFEHYKNTRFSIGAFLDITSSPPSIFDCIQSTGLKLLSIDENSDSYALILIDSSELERFISVANEAEIRINFKEK